MGCERLIIVRSCAECPLKQTETDRISCSKNNKYLGANLLELKLKHIPDWCPLMHRGD